MAAGHKVMFTDAQGNEIVVSALNPLPTNVQAVAGGDANANNQIKQILIAGLADPANWRFEVAAAFLVTNFTAIQDGTGFVVGETLVRKKTVSVTNALVSPVESVVTTWTKTGTTLATPPVLSSLRQSSAELLSECQLKRTLDTDISATLAPQVRTIKFSASMPGVVIGDSQWQ